MFRIKREDDDEEFGLIVTYLTDNEDWGVEGEARNFDSYEDAQETLDDHRDYSDRFNYSYMIEEI